MDEDHTIDVTSLMAQGVINVLGEVLKKESREQHFRVNYRIIGCQDMHWTQCIEKQTYKGEVVITASVDGPTGTRCWRE